MKHNPGFIAVVDAARRAIREIDAEQLPAELAATPGAVLVDVREDNEWQAGHIAGAVHLSRGVLERDIEARFPDPTTPLFLYCGGGYRSALAAESLGRMGYTAAVSVDGGWRRLRELMPVE